MPTDRRRDRHLNRRSTLDLPFCGVDGEGGDVDGSHEYLLLRAGKDHVLETGDPLGYWECLPFLADLPKDRIYVSYFFDYDVTMMLRKLPVERLRRLLDTDCRRIPGKPCSSFPIDVFDKFQIDYMPKKEFRVRRRFPDGTYGKWTIIHDTGTFFQSSFVSALRKWFPGDEFRDVIDKIEEGKGQRNEFGMVTEYERKYNLLEIHMLERLMSNFRDVCSREDIRPKKWQGPGNLVSAVFKREHLPGNKSLKIFDTHVELVRMANDAYYGGRFETCYFGNISGPIYQADINSAYARTYRSLPCLLHGKWMPLVNASSAGPGNMREMEGLTLARISFQHPSGLSLGTLPIRTDKGTLVFPLQGTGTYWSTEINVALKYGAKITVHKGYRYVKQCDCQHFDFVEKLYDRRKQLGKDGQGRVLKIVLASTYGKLAQSVGCAPFSNPIWAGLIVSQVRAQLADAALSNNNGGRDVLMLATDGLFSREPRTLEKGTELGQWTVTEHESMFIVQSGVYFLPGVEAKTRGLSRDINRAKLREYETEFKRVWTEFLSGDRSTPENVAIPLRIFIGLRLALHRNKPELAGQWIDMDGDDAKSISFDWTTKRVGAKVEDTYVVTDPMPGSAALVSKPYNRVIGGLRAAERLVLADQPDWGDTLYEE